MPNKSLNVYLAAVDGMSLGDRSIDICLNRTSNPIPFHINMDISLQIYD